MVYGITGKMFIGAITGIDGTGGVEMKSIEGRRFDFDTGIKLVVEKDGSNHRVRKQVDGPGILAAPFHGAADAEIKEAFKPLTDDGAAVGPGNGEGDNAYLATRAILILPLDDSKRVLFIKEAQLHPETQRNLRWSTEEPHVPDLCQWLASSEDDGSSTPSWWYASAAEIQTLYGLS